MLAFCVKKAFEPAGMKLVVEFTGSRSAPIPMSWLLRLGDLKNFLDDVGLFRTGSILSALRIAIIFSYLPVRLMFWFIWFYFILGRRPASPFVLACLARSFAFFIPLSSTPAPLKRVSLWILFSSRPRMNSYCSSRKRIWTLSISRWKPSEAADKSTVFSANFRDTRSKCCLNFVWLSSQCALILSSYFWKPLTLVSTFSLNLLVASKFLPISPIFFLY